MELKKWYTSKLVWLGILEVAIGVTGFIADLPAGTSYAAIATGVLTVIFRIVTKQAIR